MSFSFHHGLDVLEELVPVGLREGASCLLGPNCGSVDGDLEVACHGRVTVPVVGEFIFTKGLVKFLQRNLSLALVASATAVLNVDLV